MTGRASKLDLTCGLGCLMAASAALALPSAVAFAAQPVAGASYRGRTSQKSAFTGNSHPPVSFKVNSAATRIVHFNIQRVAYEPSYCNAPEPQPISSKEIPKIVIDRSGRFAGRHDESFGTGPGSTQLHYSVAGRFVSAGKAKGHARIEVLRDGHPYCDTGKVGFSARKQAATTD
jgi:hypothetical protein